MTPSAQNTPKVTPATMPKDRDPNQDDRTPETDQTPETDRTPETDDKAEKREEISRVGRNGIVNTEMPSDSANHQANVVYRDPVSGKEHGPMPLGEWADYSRKNGL